MLLLDADALSKLAHWDLLDELSALVGVQPERAATLSSLLHRARKACTKPDGKLFKDAAAAARAVNYLEKMTRLPEPDSKLIELLQSVQGIDSGEVVLFGVLGALDASILVTGDKRAIVAASHALPTAHRARLESRIVMVEQIILALLRSRGIEWLREHVCPHRSLDKAVGVVMGYDCQATAATVEEGLKSYIADLRSATDGLLRSGAPF